MKYIITFFTLILSLQFFTLSAQTDSLNIQDSTSLLQKDSISLVQSAPAVQTLVLSPFDSTQIKTWDSLDIYNQYWDNNNLFPYRYPVTAKLPDSQLIVLQDSVHKFVMPVIGRLNSPYGWRGRRMHNGIDIKLTRGDTILACMDGKVRYSKYNTGGYGYLIVIRHLNGLESYYSHLTKLKVKPNEYVKAGQFIGTGGNSGAPRVGPHLHWELRFMDNSFDPQMVVNYDTQTLKMDTLIIGPKVIKYKPTSRTGKVHIIRSGDTLGAIAARNKTSVGYLCKLNGIRRTTILQIGQRIILP